MATAPAFQVQPPPSIYGAPLTDQAWIRWYNEVLWPIIGAGIDADHSGPQGSFQQLQVGKARFTSENAVQDLINLDQGIYVNYSSTAQDIIYGFAANVHRASGANYVVGAQINAWAEVGSTGDVYGIACTAVCQPLAAARNIISFEPDVGSLSSNNSLAKWGVNIVFKNRLDGAATPGEGGIGSNLYNCYSEAIVLTAQSRTASGEFCGWSCGMDFLDGWCDQSLVPAWNNTTTYGSGRIVSSGGVLWKAIVPSTNVLPAVGAAWVQHTISGTTNLAVGIDFSSMSITGMSRMASAIRLRSTMRMHWEETGAIGTYFDAVSSVHWLSTNSTNTMYGVSAITGTPLFWRSGILPGGGAGATLGTIGGSGPTSAAMAGWFPLILNMAAGGAVVYIPFWQ